MKSSITWANWKVKVKIAVGDKMIAGVGLEPNHVWAPCCKTWLKFEIKAFRCKKKLKLRKKKCWGRGCPLSWAPCCETWLKFEGKFASVEKKNEIRDFYLLGSYPLVGRHVVNET